MSSFIKADLCPIPGYLKRKGEETLLRLIIQVDDNGEVHTFDGHIGEHDVWQCVDALTAYCSNGILQKNVELHLQELHSFSCIEIITDKQQPHFILYCNIFTLSSDEIHDELFDDGLFDDPNNSADNQTDTIEPEKEGSPWSVITSPDFSCELSHDQICSILESFQNALDGIDWDQYGKQPLFQFSTPKRDCITVYSIPEMEAVVSQYVLGHHLEGIYVNFDLNSVFFIDDYSDADQAYFWNVILMFDHGILELIPWIGSTIKLRFFSNNEITRTCIMNEIEEFDSCYYEIKGPTTDGILHGVIESVKAIETHEYQAMIKASGEDAISAFHGPDASDELQRGVYQLYLENISVYTE